MLPARKIVLSSPLRRDSSKEAGVLNKLFGGMENVISRRFCSFRSHDLKNREGAEVFSALHFDAEMTASHDEIGVYIAVAGGQAQVWTWDASLIGADNRLSNVSAVPETLLHAPAEGAVLRACLEGVEGQYWNNGSLVSSQWWSEIPTEHQWSRFRRSAGDETSHHPPSVPEVEDGIIWSRKAPPNQVPIAHLRKHFSARHVAIAIGLCLLLPIVFFATKNTIISSSIAKLEIEKTALEEITSDRRALSREIDDLRLRIEPFKRVVRNNDPLSALAPIIELLDQNNARLERFVLKDRLLELVFAVDARLEETKLVKALEEVESISDVRLETRGRGQNWVVHATLRNAQDG